MILIGRRHNREKKAVSGRTDRTFGDANLAPLKTAKKLADEYNIGERTVHRYANAANEFETLQVSVPERTQRITSMYVPDGNIPKTLSDIGIRSRGEYFMFFHCKSQLLLYLPL